MSNEPQEGVEVGAVDESLKDEQVGEEAGEKQVEEVIQTGADAPVGETNEGAEVPAPAPELVPEPAPAVVVETAEAPIPAPEPIPEPAPVVEVKPEPVAVFVAPVDAEDQVELSEEEQYLNKIRIEGTTEQKRILAAIEGFTEALRPRKEVSAEDGTKHQYEFLRHLLWALEKDYEIFRGCWNVLLVYFYLHHGKNTPSDYTALSEYSTTRFLYAWSKGEASCTAYKNLITLLRATRNKATRKHDIKTILLEKVGPEIITPKGLENLKNFYA